MYVKTNTPEPIQYQAPDCFACESCAGYVLCTSGEIDDWEYDNNGI